MARPKKSTTDLLADLVSLRKDQRRLDELKTQAKNVYYETRRVGRTIGSGFELTLRPQWPDDLQAFSRELRALSTSVKAQQRQIDAALGLDREPASACTPTPPTPPETP